MLTYLKVRAAGEEEMLCYNVIFVYLHNLQRFLCKTCLFIFLKVTDPYSALLENKIKCKIKQNYFLQCTMGLLLLKI